MTALLRRCLADLFGTPFGLAVLACLTLAGWALWSGGILDGPVAREVRASSVYAAPGVDLDRAAARRIIGNRRLVVVLLEPGADLRAGCREVTHAAAGTVVLLLSRDGQGYDTYGCALLPGREDENLGRTLAAETTIGRGIDTFADRPLEALKVVAVNYDLLVRAGAVPDGARTISPSAPRFLLAGAAVVGVVTGAALLYAGGRRAGRLAARRRRDRDDHADARSQLSAAVAVLGQRIVDLDRRYERVGGPAGPGDDDAEFRTAYLRLTSDYVALLDGLGPDADVADVPALLDRVDALHRRAADL